MIEGIDLSSVKLQRELTVTDVGILLVEVIKQLKTLNEMAKDAWTLDGTTMTNEFTLPQGWPVVRIDFVDSQFHKNKPNNVSFEVPECPVQQLKISNLGPSIVSYSTNKFRSQLESASTLVAGETIKIETPKRSIKGLNIVSNGGAAKVRVEVLM